MVVARALVVLALFGGALSGCARARPTSHQVAIRNFAYEPAAMVVATGDTVVWKNADFVAHTVTASDRAWDSGSLAAEGAWRFVPSAPGTYAYYCTFHPNMKASIEAR